MKTEQVEQLREEVQRRYREATAEDAKRHGRKVFPDFREYNGMRLSKLGFILTAKQAEHRTLDDIAGEFVQRVVDFERALVVGAGGDSNVTRCFLKNNELPNVFLKVPSDQQASADVEDRGAVKLRHVFGVLGP